MQTNRSNTAALVGGAILIALGLLSLAGRAFRFLDWGLLWPFIVIGFGGLFFVGMLAGGRSAAGLAIPGSIVGGIGLVLLFQNLTHYWQSMSYFWTLIVLFAGAGIYLMGWYADDVVRKRAGLRVVRVGLVLFIIFGAFFELIFSSFNNLLFPVLLIALGACLIVVRSGLWAARKPETRDPLPPENL